MLFKKKQNIPSIEETNRNTEKLVPQAGGGKTDQQIRDTYAAAKERQEARAKAEKERIKALREAFKDQKGRYHNLVFALRQQPQVLRPGILSNIQNLRQMFNRSELKRLAALAHEGLTRKQLRKVGFHVRPKTIRARCQAA